MIKHLFRSIAKIIAKKNFYIIKSLAFDPEDRLQIPINLDFVRHKTLELCSHEIRTNKVTGNVAELGVYKGDFAVKINELFPDRKLYLFDTFTGFDTRDIGSDKTKFSTEDQDFSDTTIEFVLKRMKYPENCIIKKGYFPDTAIDINDSFSFVSIDADLYEPILKGLEFFYPRLEKYGYIFIHDFNNKHYKGAREAVLKFCLNNKIGYLPLPDNGGSVIVIK